jgi:hypothetical protein
VIDHDQIVTSRQKLSAEFVRAVQGPATREVSSRDAQAAALGQHLHAATAQRGLHGTAAAIEVLAQTPGPEAQELTRRLVHYVDDLSTIEQTSSPLEIPHRDVRASERNVIKMSEVLYSLASVTTSLAPREQLARKIAESLVSNCETDGGWPYYMTGDHKTSDVVPTAYATRALASHGYDVSKNVDFLVNSLVKATSDQTDIFVEVLTIYILCYLSEGYRRDKELKKPFEDTWSRLSPLLNQDVEANIEYLTDKINYVRIPWQLYLLAAAAHLSPYRRFASASAQRRLKSIIQSVLASGGLLYPHSGRDLSSRTNAILFDVLNKMDDELTIRRLPLTPFVWIERFKSAIASRPFRYSVRAVVLGLIVFAVVRWSTSHSKSIADLAPELLSSALLILLTGKRDA